MLLKDFHIKGDIGSNTNRINETRSMFATQRSQHCEKITTLTFLAIKRLHPIRNGSWTAPCRVLHFKLAGIWQKNWRQWQNSTELFEKKLWVFCIDAGLSLFDLSLKNKFKLFDVWSRLVRLLCFSWPEKRETFKGTVVLHSERPNATRVFHG